MILAIFGEPQYRAIAQGTTDRRLPAEDVPLHAIEINRQSGRIEIKNSVAWLGAEQSDCPEPGL
jgi:hypothetical protein